MSPDQKKKKSLYIFCMSPIIYHLKKKNLHDLTKSPFGFGIVCLHFENHILFFFLFLVPAALFDQVNREQYTDALFIVTINSTFQPLFH